MNFKSKTMNHLKTIITHRHYVFHFCRQAGIPFQGLLHDLSKFNPIEFCEGVRYFTGKKSPIDKCKELTGRSEAWLHHRGRNKHHWEYWVDYLSDGGIPVEMPYQYVVEMLCDWAGAGMAYNKLKFKQAKEAAQNEVAWYKARKDSMKLALKTREFVNSFFEILENFDYDYNLVLKRDVLRMIWVGTHREEN